MVGGEEAVFASGRWDAVIHIHSSYSFRGLLTPEEIVALASERGIDAVFFSDDALVKIKYGFIGIQKTSVYKKGLRRYLRELETIDRKFPDLTVVPGVEVAPHYEWDSSPFWGKGVVRNWNKHLLVYGLDEKTFRDLPFGGRGAGETPYQRMIDGVVQKGGLIFWAHPEARDIPRKFGPVTFVTDPYPESLERTDRYTGFAILFEGMKTIGIPGGIWDRLLTRYCEGKKGSPVWAIGELDYTEEGRAGTWIDTVKTVIFSETNRAPDLLEALRKGRMYALRRIRERELVLESFWVEEGSQKALSGETLPATDSPKIHFAVSYSDGTPKTVQVKIIRGGEILQNLALRTPVSFTVPDPEPSDRKTFYRLEIMGDRGEILLTNPIFVSFSKKEGQ